MLRERIRPFTDWVKGCCGWTLLAALLAGCAAVPAAQEGENSAPKGPVKGSETVAIRQAFGIRMAASAAAWSGLPNDLKEKLTPIHIRIENRSGRAIQIRFDRFSLVGVGFRRFPLRPADFHEMIDVREGPSPRRISFFPHAFGRIPGTPPLFLTGAGSMPGPFVFDPFSSERDHSSTGHFVNSALKEGILETNDRLSGFLYFRKIGKTPSPFHLNIELFDAQAEETFGTVTIPLQMR